MTVAQNYLKCALCTVPIFVDDELTAAADLSSSGTEESFMSKSYSLRTNPDICCNIMVWLFSDTVGLLF